MDSARDHANSLNVDRDLNFEALGGKAFFIVTGLVSDLAANFGGSSWRGWGHLELRFHHKGAGEDRDGLWGKREVQLLRFGIDDLVHGDRPGDPGKLQRYQIIVGRGVAVAVVPRFHVQRDLLRKLGTPPGCGRLDLAQHEDVATLG